MRHYNIIKLLSDISNSINTDDDENLKILFNCDDMKNLYAMTNNFFKTYTYFHDSHFEVISEKTNVETITAVKVYANIGMDDTTKYIIKFIGVNEKLRKFNNTEIEAMFFVKTPSGYTVYCIFMHKHTSKRYVKSFQVKDITFDKE